MSQSCAHLCATPATLEIVAAMLKVHGACTVVWVVDELHVASTIHVQLDLSNTCVT